MIFATDLHLYDEMPFVKEWCEQVKDTDVLIFGGDIADPWKAPWEKILALNSWAAIQAMVRNRSDKGLKTYYIRGNHDWNIKPSWIEGAEVCNKVIIGNLEFRHGWERDATWLLVNRAAFFIADHLPSLAIRIHKMLYGEMSVAPSSIAALDLYESWNLHVGAIHTLWREYADKHKKKLIVGHCHCQWNDPLLTDCGALYMGQWVTIDKEVRLEGKAGR